jgi:myo-inositol-1(or 4)-monophosphatase
MGARPDWSGLLGDAMERVQLVASAIAIGGDRSKVVGTGASGDVTILADSEAEGELLRALAKADGVKVLSEEAGIRGDTKGKVVAIIDPLDGSANFKRGVPFYCTSVAIAEGGTLDKVTFGMIRNLVNGDVYEATKGEGATKNGERIRTSRAKTPMESVVGIDVSRAQPSLIVSLAPLVGAVERQVHYGANALELCFLAEGKIDAFVDLRDKMRITDFAAAYLIAKEAGATVTGPGGAKLSPAFDLSDRFSFIAAANLVLHKRILGLAPGAATERR